MIKLPVTLNLPSKMYEMVWQCATSKEQTVEDWIIINIQPALEDHANNSALNPRPVFFTVEDVRHAYDEWWADDFLSPADEIEPIDF